MRSPVQLGLSFLFSLLALGCVARPVDLSPGDEADDLMDALGPRVLILANPQDSLVGVLGAVIDPVTGAPIPTRPMIVPSATRSMDLVRYSGVRAMSVASGVAIDLLGGGTDAEASHVSYDVSVWDTYYLVGAQPYDAGSRCCGESGVDPSCRAGYVTRVFVGSGTLRFLSEESTSGSFEGGPIEVHGERSYRVERERRFTSSVFAVEVAPADPVCERAFCDEREASGACGRCVVMGMEAELSSMTAPADGALSLVCEHMRAGAEATLSLRGDVIVEDCDAAPSVTVALRSDGALAQRFELSSTPGADGPLTFSRRSEVVRASESGVLVAELDLLDCRCGEASARCALDRELELSIEASAWD